LAPKVIPDTFQIGTWRKYLVHVWKTDSYLSKRPIDLEMWHALKLMKVGTYKSISVVYMTPSNQMENSDCLLESNNYLGIQKFGFIVNWNKTIIFIIFIYRSCRSHDRIRIGFTSTYEITKVVNLWWGFQDTWLCDKSLSVTSGNLLVLCRYSSQINFTTTI
jgi:hypothetical protein